MVDALVFLTMHVAEICTNKMNNII
jgi:hypothetical protein